MIRSRVLTSVMVLAMTASVATQSPQKKFMGGPVTIEDQGSFFIGGVTKVTEHAAVPFAPPGQPAPPPVPQQITIGQMYVQFQIPQRKSGPGWPVIMVHGSTHTGAALESTPDGREGWFRTSSARASPPTSSISPDAAVPASISRCCTRPRQR